MNEPESDVKPVGEPSDSRTAAAAPSALRHSSLLPGVPGARVVNPVTELRVAARLPFSAWHHYPFC